MNPTIQEIANMRINDYEIESEFDVSNEDLELWCSQNLLLQLTDIGREVECLIDTYENNENRINDSCISYLERIHEYCSIIYMESCVCDVEKSEIKDVEWELLNFFLGGNSMGSTLESIRRYWDQYVHHLNWGLLV